MLLLTVCFILLLHLDITATLPYHEYVMFSISQFHVFAIKAKYLYFLSLQNVPCFLKQTFFHVSEYFKHESKIMNPCFYKYIVQYMYFLLFHKFSTIKCVQFVAILLDAPRGN